MTKAIKACLWLALMLVVVVPMGAAAMSPLLAWREPIYIAAGFAGVAGLILLFFQPILAAGVIPDLSLVHSRRAHRWVGAGVVISVTVHVAGLWITSPPDVIDALLFSSPTPFSVWGVVAMWGVFVTACLAMLRYRLRIKPRLWRITHGLLAVAIVAGSVVHAMMIEGTMELLSKTALCVMVVIATFTVLGNNLRR